MTIFLNLIAILLLVSTNAFGDPPGDWLGPYLNSKGIRCSLNQDQLRRQVGSQIDSTTRQLFENLKARGSEIESLKQDRDQIEIGIFPKTPILDLYVLEQVSVVIQNLNFRVQTTYKIGNADNPAVQQGLWFPLTINDPGPGSPCTLSRITYKEEDRDFVPIVDLVIGEPPRVVAHNVAQVMDPADGPKPPTPPPPPIAKKEPPPPESPPPPTVKKEVIKEPPPPPEKLSKKEEKEEEEKSTARVRTHYRRHHHHQEEEDEDRSSRHHRHHRYYYHYRHRHHRSEATEEQKSKESTVPPPANSCSGDVSPWKSAACKLGILK
jgi:hypothetical protein